MCESPEDPPSEPIEGLTRNPSPSPPKASAPKGAATADLAILGGGIAGLWLLGRLREAGYRAVLVETRCLGGVQTLASQGILHGGVKYALGGHLTESARAVAEMPERWRACLRGAGELDLSGVRQHSPHQYLWSTRGLVSRMTGFFAGKAMRARMQRLPRADYPPPFDNPGFQGDLYRLEEPVLDVPSLVQQLVGQYAKHCLRAEHFPKARAIKGGYSLRFGDQELRARGLILAAGAANARLLEELGRTAPAMQRRPLHMVMLRGPLPSLYGHCLGAGANPRLTVTTHPLGDGDMVWYLGGDVAEQGVKRTDDEQIAAARSELQALLPWVDLTRTRWATLRVDRAEVATADGKRPDDCFLHHQDRLFTVWPTKLVLAPRLADRCLEAIESSGLRPGAGPLQPPPLPPATPCPPPWESIYQWN